MSQNPDLNQGPDYYSARASEERARAGAATDENARAAHLELARFYDERSSRDATDNEPI